MTKMTTAQINRIADTVLQLKKKSDALADKKGKIDVQLEDARAQMLNALKETELQGIKRGDHRIQINKRWQVRIWNDEKVVAEIRRLKLKHALEERITPYFRSSIAPDLAKKGVTLDGMEVTQTEMLVVSKGEPYVPKDGRYPRSFSKASVKRMLSE